MSDLIKMTVKGARKLYQDAEAYTRKEQAALRTAIKVEGFRRLRALRDEIRAGNPGGKPYLDDLSRIARRTKTGRLKKKPIPLYRLARLLRYNIDYEAGGNIKLSFGFVNTNTNRLGSSWKKLLIQHQEGTDVLYGGSREELGRRLARIGGRLKRSGDPDAKFFFLRKTTGRKIELPRRPMIEPFWATYRADAARSIKENFRRKMRGERI